MANTAPTQHEGPDSKDVLSLRTVRITSVQGPCAIVEAGKPKRIPRALFLEAARNGCVDYNPEMVQAFRNAVLASSEAESKENADAVSYDRLMKDAVRQVLIAAEEAPELLTRNGTPRVAAVRSAFDSACAELDVTPDIEINRELIETVFEQVDAADTASALDRSKEGGYIPPSVDRLGDGEVGGLDDDLLARVAETDPDD